MLTDPNDKDARLLETITNYFLQLNKPMCFNPYNEQSVLINGEKEFEDICYSMEDGGMKDIKQSTVFEFYNKILFLEKKVRRLKNIEK